MIDVPPGTVFIKGLVTAAWDLKELRKLFGVTPQDSYLFSDSIRNNIGYGVNESYGVTESSGPHSDDVLRRAAVAAALEKDFPLFRDGWDTLIGERGLTLSGGQKQRTAIARSVAAEREILILDDSLSSVDAETEKNILDALFELSRLRALARAPLTMLIVSHRVSALNRADRVIVLDKGRIIEEGAPAELAALSGGFYARTAALQRLGMRNAFAEQGSV
jgi:ATP-binding cassette subfamily B protein